jgi:hypothetical protein
MKDLIYLRVILVYIARSNIPINKALSKEVENGKIVQTLPLIGFEGRMYPLFTPISPIHCSVCGNPIKPNEKYDRSLISSYGTISCPTTYWICLGSEIEEASYY